MSISNWMSHPKEPSVTALSLISPSIYREQRERVQER
jgi:hypothetical protein